VIYVKLQTLFIAKLITRGIIKLKWKILYTPCRIRWG